MESSGSERKYDTFGSNQDSHLSFFPAQSSRKHLKWSISGVCLFGCLVIILNIIFASATYGYVNHSDPIIISPYMSLSSTNATYLQPCIFTRLNSSFSSSDLVCSTGGYCPANWQCNSVSIDGQPIKVCTNINFECPNNANCYEFIDDLPQFMVDGIPIVESDVGVNTGNFAASIVLSIITLICFICLWIIYEIWIKVAGDPFSDTYGTKGRAHSGFAGSLADKYENIFDNFLQSSPKKCYFVIAVCYFFNFPSHQFLEKALTLFFFLGYFGSFYVNFFYFLSCFYSWYFS